MVGNDFGAVVIGAGVVGCAVAVELARSHSPLLVLDKASRPGQGVTSRNSGVVHAGIYHSAAFFKRRLCIEGRRLLYAFAEQHGVPFSRLGKLVVAQDGAEAEALQQLLDTAEACGVEGLSHVTARELARLEPDVCGRSAVLSSQSGVVDPHRLVDALVSVARAADASFLFSSELAGVSPVAGGYELEVLGGDGSVSICTTAALVNSAGLDADRVMGMMMEDAPVHRFVRGHYFRIAPEHAGRVTRLIYPVPPRDLAGLGVHLTLDLDGGMRLGPDVQWLGAREEDFRVDEGLRESFAAAGRRFLPWLEPSMLHPDMAGIRSKLSAAGQAAADFWIRPMEGHENFINLCGIESPGLTASLAIAKQVARLLG